MPEQTVPHLVSQVASTAEASHIGTKADLAQLVGRLEQIAAEMRAEFAKQAARIDQMASKADLSALEARMFRWFIGTAITLTALVFAVTRAAG